VKAILEANICETTESKTRKEAEET